MKILVVDDHALHREGLRDVLKELTSDVLVLEASDCRETAHFVDENPDLDLVLLDLSLPDGSGLDLLAELRERYPAISVVVLSAHHDREHVLAAIERGAVGFIPKSAKRSVIA